MNRPYPTTRHNNNNHSPLRTALTALLMTALLIAVPYLILSL
jgi:hypothetical protein